MVYGQGCGHASPPLTDAGGAQVGAWGLWVWAAWPWAVLGESTVDEVLVLRRSIIHLFLGLKAEVPFTYLIKATTVDQIFTFVGCPSKPALGFRS